MQTGPSRETTQRRVLIFPASTPAVAGRKIHFLFSLSQVVDIMREIPFLPVPLSPEAVDGIVQWRDHVAPVASLEKCLGLPAADSPRAQRLILVRAPGEAPDHPAELRCGFRAPRDLRMLPLPIPCTPTTPGNYIPESRLVKAAYEWENKVLVAPDLAPILKGEFRESLQPLARGAS